MTSAVREQEPLWKRILDAANFNDHMNYQDPYGFGTLGQRWQDKTIGKEWREGQMADVWDLLPDEWKPGVAEWGKGMAEKFGTAWMDARTLEGKEWLDPGKIAAAGTARSLEAIGIPFELLAQGVTQVTGLDIELSRLASDFIPVGAGISKLSKIARQSRLAKRVSQLQNLAPNELAYLQSQANKIKQITQPGGKWGFVEDATGIPSISGAEEAGLLMRVSKNLGDSDYGWIDVRQSSLHPGGPTGKFPAGKGRELSSELITGIEVTKEIKDRFTKAGMDVYEEIKQRLGIVLDTPEIHHKGLLRQIWETMNGLDENWVTESKRYYQRALGFKLGDAISNAGPVPKIFHPMLHAIMNKRLGGTANTWSLKALEKKFGLAKDWKRTTKYPQRIPIYDEVIDTISESIKDVETLWSAIESRTVLLGNLPEEQFIKTTMDLLNLDDKILDAGKLNLGKTIPGVDTATDVANHLLEKAGKIDLSLPKFSKLNPTDLQVVAKLEILDEKILREALLTKQSAASVYKAYNLKDLLNIELKDFKALLNRIDPDDLVKAGMSIEDVDLLLRTSPVDSTGKLYKGKSSLKELDIESRTDWTKDQLRQAFPDMDEFDIEQWIVNQEYINMDK